MEVGGGRTVKHHVDALGQEGVIGDAVIEAEVGSQASRIIPVQRSSINLWGRADQFGLAKATSGVRIRPVPLEERDSTSTGGGGGLCRYETPAWD